MALNHGKPKNPPNPRAIQDVNGIFKSICRSCHAFDQKLRLVQDSACSQPYTDLVGKTVHVPLLKPYWPIEQIRLWRGYTTHEIGHHAPEVQDTTQFLLDTGIRYTTPFGRIMNLLDDVRNELNPRLQQFAGFRDDLSWTQGYHALKGAKGLATGKPSPEMEPFLQAMGLVYLFRGQVQPHVAHPAALWEGMGYGNNYHHLLPRLAALRTIQDVFELAQEFMPYDDKSEDSDKSESQGQGDEEGEGSPENQTGESSGSDESEEEKPGGAGKGDGDDDGESSVAGDTEISYKDLLSHEHSDDAEFVGTSPHDFKINYDHDRMDDYEPYSAWNVQKARDLTTSSYNEWRTEEEARTEILGVLSKGEKLSARARRLFQARMQVQVTHNHKAGRLDKRDLYRIPSGATDVFKRKSDAVTPKGVAVMVLGDCSASMSGNEYDYMAASLTLLHEAITPLGCPLKLALFTEQGMAQHYVIKEWEERRNREELLSDFFKAENHMGCNTDGESIMWASQELMKRTEPRKLLIVLSDGQPSSNAPGDAWTYTRDVVLQVSKHIECYGIGMKSDSVRDFYKDHEVLWDLNKLEDCLLSIIKEKVFKL